MGEHDAKPDSSSMLSRSAGQRLLLALGLAALLWAGVLWALS